jgi:hypothetical protein
MKILKIGITSELIEEFAFQSFTAYYNGLYFASYMLSTSCLELTLKYELVRNRKIDASELEKNNCTLFWAIERIDKIGLGKYKSRLAIIHNMRNGMFHFNPKKMTDSLISIQNETIRPDIKVFIGVAGGPSESEGVIEAHSGDFPWSISEYVDNKDWSKVAFFTYAVMFDITKQLYGEDKKIDYIKEGLKDYDLKKKQGN